jgi:hypothetical protein
VLSGKRLELLRQDARAAMMKGKDGVEVPEYQIYPSDLPDS